MRPRSTSSARRELGPLEVASLVLQEPFRWELARAFALGAAGAMLWVGWCSLAVGAALVLGRWFPLDAALALVGSLNLAAGSAALCLVVRPPVPHEPGPDLSGGMA